ncbi:MAG TPA: hypothetical protein ENK20_07810 [Chromatiales bacterium]|nr:hypothetical protein [Chromatiales bacterium]
MTRAEATADRIAAAAALAGGAAVVLAAPAAGALLAGEGLPPLAFPPRPTEPGPASLSVGAAFLVGWIGAATIWAALAAALGCRPGQGPAPARGPWPRWGWAALAWTGLWWLVAWTRIPALDPVQPLTFTPLWLGYIAVAAALLRRLGARRPRGRDLALLAGASAVWWWLFEYLNAYVRNWHYLGTERYGDAAYALLATAAFATVLPAVALTTALLGRLRRPWRCPARLRPVRVRRPGRSAALWALAGAALLAAAGAFPAQAYPLIWAAPAMVLAGLQRLLGRPTWLAPLARGDWRPVVLPALAALVCGLFWELWNWRSLARWAYTLPGLQAPALFAMPLTGWAGYLPFGVSCAVFADLVLRAAGRGGLAAALGWDAPEQPPEEGSR